jgi:NADH:ubiquinone oxidoreductase subunit E
VIHINRTKPLQFSNSCIARDSSRHDFNHFQFDDLRFQIQTNRRLRFMNDTTMSAPRVGIGPVTGPEVNEEIRRVIAKNKGEAGALIRVLQQAQGIVGYLPAHVLETISAELQVPLSEIYGIVSFYSFFSVVPKGKHVAQVCTGTACYVKGGEKIINAFAKDLKLEPGGVTDDGSFSLETVRCLGCCGLSPVMAVGEDVYRRVQPREVKDIIDSYDKENAR